MDVMRDLPLLICEDDLDPKVCLHSELHLLSVRLVTIGKSIIDSLIKYSTYRQRSAQLLSHHTLTRRNELHA